MICHSSALVVAGVLAAVVMERDGSAATTVHCGKVRNAKTHEQTGGWSPPWTWPDGESDCQVYYPENATSFGLCQSTSSYSACEDGTYTVTVHKYYGRSKEPGICVPISLPGGWYEDDDPGPQAVTGAW